MLDKPSVLAINKIDVPGSKELLEAFYKQFENYQRKYI